MQNVNEIVSRLNQGESLENIAAELTTVLNEAKKVYDAEQEKEAAIRMAQDRRSALADIVDEIVAWVREFYPDLYSELAEEVSIEEAGALRETILDAVIQAMNDVTQSKGPARYLDPATMMVMSSFMGGNQKPTKSKKAKSENDVLDSFLKTICH